VAGSHRDRRYAGRRGVVPDRRDLVAHSPDVHYFDILIV
jgi:hypothetical protein